MEVWRFIPLIAASYRTLDYKCVDVQPRADLREYRLICYNPLRHHSIGEVFKIIGTVLTATLQTPATAEISYNDRSGVCRVSIS